MALNGFIRSPSPYFFGSAVALEQDVRPILTGNAQVPLCGLVPATSGPFQLRFPSAAALEYSLASPYP